MLLVEKHEFCSIFIQIDKMERWKVEEVDRDEDD